MIEGIIITPLNVIETIGGNVLHGMKSTESETQVHEARFLNLNCDKAHQLLGWYPRWHVEKTLEATALWYKTIMNGGNAEQITRAQIHAFFPELT